MRVLLVVLFFFSLGGWFNPVVGIVPKPGVPLENYAAPAKHMNNIGRLMVQGKKTSSCSSALIGIDGDIGIVLTAGHCADLTSEEEVTKCRFQTISFSSDNTHKDPQQMPIIGRTVIGTYVEKPGFVADIGIVFVDLRDGVVPAAPLTMALEPEDVPNKTLVKIVGYGKTNLNDELRNPKRLAMSTEAVRSTEHGHDILWIDESDVLENQPLEAPIGDHPANGDSGGATINVDTGEIIGVVSHSTNWENYYSEPLYPHAEWLKAQIKNARRYLVFKPLRSGKFSDNSIWANNHRKPMSFKNSYGEINPIIEIDGKSTLSMDEESLVYAINMLGEGGSLDIQTPEQHAEVLRVYAPTVITSPNDGRLVVETVKVNHSDFSLQAQLRILYSLEVKESAIMDTRKGSPTRGITLVDNGNILVDGTLKTHHIHFAPVNSDDLYSMRGVLQVSGRIEVDEPLIHIAQEVHGIASNPGEILGDYLLSEKGVLSFSLDTKTPTSEPILKIDGVAKLSGGTVSVKSPFVLPVGFEQTLLSAKELHVLPNYLGVYSPKMVDETSEIVFIPKEDKLIMKVVPIAGKVLAPSFVTEVEDLLN